MCHFDFTEHLALRIRITPFFTSVFGLRDIKIQNQMPQFKTKIHLQVCVLLIIR